ncbi:MAG TPA: sigma-70 family RNA polymerase sigma factor [Atribacterota bacterium]|nr:sigma-70 family RNA polymerase sigma factor [Atribacterota bacterium]
MRFFYAHFYPQFYHLGYLKPQKIKGGTNMLKKFQTQEGDITIEITEKGKAIYSVGKKKTTFDLSKCDSFTYRFVGEEEKFVITEDMLSGTDEIEPWMWLVISRGEDRLEYNNDQAETRRQRSCSDQNDKSEMLTSGEDALDHLLSSIEKDTVRKAIRSLDPPQQELVLDVYYRGLSMAAVARRDKVSKMAVTNRMKKIIKRLQENLKDF